MRGGFSGACHARSSSLPPTSYVCWQIPCPRTSKSPAANCWKSRPHSSLTRSCMVARRKGTSKSSVCPWYGSCSWPHTACGPQMGEAGRRGGGRERQQVGDGKQQRRSTGSGGSGEGSRTSGGESTNGGDGGGSSNCGSVCSHLCACADDALCEVHHVIVVSIGLQGCVAGLARQLRCPLSQRTEALTRQRPASGLAASTPPSAAGAAGQRTQRTKPMQYHAEQYRALAWYSSIEVNSGLWREEMPSLRKMRPISNTRSSPPTCVWGGEGTRKLGALLVFDSREVQRGSEVRSWGVAAHRAERRGGAHPSRRLRFLACCTPHPQASHTPSLCECSSAALRSMGGLLGGDQPPKSRPHQSHLCLINVCLHPHPAATLTTSRLRCSSVAMRSVKLRPIVLW